MNHDELADLLLQWALEEPEIRALWIEGESLDGVRRPYRDLAAHIAADEPSYASLLDRTPQALETRLGARVVRMDDTPRFAKKLQVDTRGLPWTLIVEKTSLLAKRPRAHVVPLLDRTGHLTHVMDFSGRSGASRPAAPGLGPGGGHAVQERRGAER
jgi:hypothetical protein